MISMNGKIKSFLILLLITISGINSYAQKVGPWNLEELYKTPQWEETKRAQQPGMKGILYQSIPYKGNEVQVFAYYMAPEGDMPKGGWPAVVCVHGGGGTAFNKWVKKWNDQGYAAISMDLEGHYPIKDTINGKLQRIPTEKPGISRKGTFLDFNLPVEEQWYFNAVAHIIKAHSLICSFPEINAQKTGITGISWGGILTSTVMGVDNRFKFAIPVYGCGFLPEADGFQGENIKPGKHSDMVNKYFDGSAYFENVTIPTFWLNGTNDKHFSILSTQKSSQAVNGPVTLRYAKGMIHGHSQGWNPKEIYAFANSIINGGELLIQFKNLKVKRHSISSIILSDKNIAKVALFYTKDSGIWNKRKWKVANAKIKKNQLTAKIPVGATTIYLSATDEDGYMVTSEFIEI